jgi:hypothetical protein
MERARDGQREVTAPARGRTPLHALIFAVDTF